MSNVSSIPAVTDKVIALLTAALPNVVVLDGPAPTDASEGDYLAVGAAQMLPSSDGVEAFNGSQTWHATGYSRLENFTLLCVARSWNGDGDAKAARDAAFATVAAVETQLRNDPTWGGVCLASDGISGLAGRSGNTSGGTFAEVTFDLSFQSLI